MQALSQKILFPCKILRGTMRVHACKCEVINERYCSCVSHEICLGYIWIYAPCKVCTISTCLKMNECVVINNSIGGGYKSTSQTKTVLICRYTRWFNDKSYLPNLCYVIQHPNGFNTNLTYWSQTHNTLFKANYLNVFFQMRSREFLLKVS